jgi:hypothetical protein
MSEEHRRRTDHNGNTLHERKTDSDYIARLGDTIERYKIFWLIVMAVFAWWSRTIIVPLRESAMTTTEVRLINRKIDSVIVPRLDSADHDRSRMIVIQQNQGALLGVLSRLQCLHTTPIDRAKISLLDCRDIPVEFAPVPKKGDGF